MEKNEQSPKLQSRRTPCKSPSRHRNSPSEKPILLNLESDSPSGREKHESKRENGESSSAATPSHKKRKRNVTPTEGLDEMLEEEIEKQWDEKAEKNNLTVLNVKNILKSVITNKYVVDMMRQTIEKGNFTDTPFEPKFTRAKKKELLEQVPGASLPPVVGLMTPLRPPPPDIDPEIKLLMDSELHEDSSDDEEYNPDNEVVEQSDDDESRGEASFLSDAESMPPTPGSIHAPPTPLEQEGSQDGTFKVPQENVGQRTRSKLDLNTLAVESLEQMFVPPDVPDDMYDEECDNPDWQEFLQECAQPICPNETLDDDPEEDPEYNILADEVKLKVDKEEMRKDKAVKVSRKELNVLMKELFEYTDLAAGYNDIEQTTESLAELEASIMQETEDRRRREEMEMESIRKLEEIEKQEELKRRKKERRGLVPTQKLLLAQQMRQHVQLTTQHFLQTYKHPMYHSYSGICRTMLTTLTGLTTDKVFSQPIDNLKAAVETVDKWEELHNHPETGEKIRGFVKEQMALEKVRRKAKYNTHMNFPAELMRTAVESEAFLYPSLLPSAPFRTTFNMAGPNSFTPSEDMLIAISLEQVTQLMEERKRKYKKRRLIDKAGLIFNTSIPRCSPAYIAKRISMQSNPNKTMNPIQCYIHAGEVPTIVHCVLPIQRRLKLSHRPLQQLPETWRAFLNKETSTHEKSSKTPGCKSRKQSKDLTAKPSSKTDLSIEKSSAGPVKSSVERMDSSGKSNTAATLPCTKVCSVDLSFKNAFTDCRSSMSLKKLCVGTKLKKKESPVKLICKNKSSSMTNSICNGHLPTSVNNKRDERELMKRCNLVKSSKCNDKFDCSIESIDPITNSNSLVKKSASKCKVQPAKKSITGQNLSCAGSNLFQSRNLLDSDVQKTVGDTVKSNTNKKEEVTKSPQVTIVIKPLLIKAAKSPERVRNSMKRVSFHLGNIKKDSSKPNSHKEKLKIPPHPRKVKFSLKFKDNPLGPCLNKTNNKLIQISSASNFFEKSGLGLVKKCSEPEVGNKEIEISEGKKSKAIKCNSVLNNAMSPTKAISHCPRPPSTVKLKKL